MTSSAGYSQRRWLRWPRCTFCKVRLWPLHIGFKSVWWTCKRCKAFSENVPWPWVKQ